MPQGYHPLVVPTSQQSQSHLSRSYSLRAALLAFPLPSPTPTTLLSPRRHRHSTVTPLQNYNANYDRLFEARQTRLRVRQSQLLSPEPAYTLPESYSEIQRLFPRSSPAAESLLVELDESPQAYSEDILSHTRTRGRRSMVLREGNIAARQRVRKLAKRKDPKEVSVNILRNTSAVVKRGTTDTMKRAIGLVKSSGVRVFGKMSWLENKERERAMAGGDELHKFFYDWHSPEMEETEEEGNEGEKSLETGMGARSVVYRRSVDTGGRIAVKSEIGETGMRRQTWTNLSDVLMGQSHHEEDAVEEDMQEVDLQENDGLETIQEVTEISPCGKLYVTHTLHTPQQHQPLIVNPFHSPTTPSRPRSSTASLHSHASSLASPAKLYPISPDTSPHKSLRQLSSTTQDLFNVSTTAFPGNTTSDPIKPISPLHYPNQQDGEITRGEDDVSMYSDFLPAPPVKRSISILGTDEYDPPTRVISRKFSTSTAWDSMPLTFGSRTASSSRILSAVGTNWIPTAPLPLTHEIPIFPPTKTEVVLRHVSSVVEPSIESSKWAPAVEEGEVRGKSVKDRVKELDLVIDQAMGFNKDGGKKVGGGAGRKGVFGLWRS